ncbi:hypothetical protein [Nocardia macrotermitis]|uniref:Uncharacterized protein n=1 Tax=Nocardia macrotermitis TaxID=2585198 RepID=A0A7K0CVB1_9NOCA|nr:hypothetical protein [Nocardia macrotermitis]MQY17450.1 hypothetical protein [Nocardia macrotermitis]
MTLAEIEERLAQFDALLQPVARYPIDMSDAEWAQKLRAAPDSLTQAGIRGEVVALVRAVLAEYARGDAELRTALRVLYARYRSFRWAAAIPTDATTAEGFRLGLLQLSIRDHGEDSRDEILTLDEDCRLAAEAGVDIAPILREVAAMSSDVDKYGMGSMRDTLLGHAH